MPYPDESNLTSLPRLRSIIDPQPDAAGGVSFIEVTAGGTGYTNPTVNITAPPAGGVQAVAIAVVTNGVITAIVVTTKGSGYLEVNPPAISFSGGGGANATAVAYVGADYMLSWLIKAVSRTIIEECNFDIPVFDSGNNITERRNGSGADRMIVRTWPIISISTLTIGPSGTVGTTVIPASDGLSNGYLFDTRMIYLIGYIYPKGWQNVNLVYRAGEVLGSHRQIQLEQAAILTAMLWWKRRPRIDLSSISPSGIGSTTFTTKDLPPEAWTIINNIRDVVAVV